MPRDGDTPLARFVHAIVREDGFAFGSPRLSDDGATVTVPVIRTVPRRRRYVLVGEASEPLFAEETGRLDRLRVRNDSQDLVVLPAGTIFEGRRTASRGTVAGLLLGPCATREVEVRCVAPSRPIVPGEALRPQDGLAAFGVTQALLSRDQGRVWATLRPGEPEADADATNVRPADVRECGSILLDAEGVIAAEVYDDPRSWAAAGARRWGPSSANPLGLNAANAGTVARRSLEALASGSFHAAGPSSWVADDISASFMLLDGEVVCLILFGRDLTRPGRSDSAQARANDGAHETPDVAASDWSETAGSDAEVAAVARGVLDVSDGAPPPISGARPRRRKVLTTGWDAATFASLERLTHKEFGGDRSAAIRTLVRRGLQVGGYLGPRSPAPMTAAGPMEAGERLAVPDADEAALAARIREYERIAQTEAYAEWLRKRARFEVERLTGGIGGPEPAEAGTSALVAPLEPDLGEASAPEEVLPEAPPLPPPPPVDVRPLLRRAFAASAAGRYPDALVVFDEVLTAEPDNRTALLGRAVALRRSGKAQEALAALDAVLRVDPTNAAALLNRGRLLQERGDLEAALEAFDVLATVAPNDWDVWLVRGDVLAKLGRRAEALQAYSEAQRRNPDDQALALRIRSLESAESAPLPPPAPRAPLPRDVQEGQSYLVREPRPTLSLRVLRALAARGVPSLAISPRPPEAVRLGVGIAGLRVLELTHAPGDDRHDPTALAALGHLVARFVREGRGHGVIAVDGLGSLVQENGARETLLFIERVHEAVLQSHAVFLVSVAPGELSDREIALLERSLRTLS